MRAYSQKEKKKIKNVFTYIVTRYNFRQIHSLCKYKSFLYKRFISKSFLKVTNYISK